MFTFFPLLLFKGLQSQRQGLLATARKQMLYLDTYLDDFSPQVMQNSRSSTYVRTRLAYQLLLYSTLLYFSSQGSI